MTLDVLPYQAEALVSFETEPRKLSNQERTLSPFANLIRRGLLVKVPGEGLYALSEEGRWALVRWRAK